MRDKDREAFLSDNAVAEIIIRDTKIARQRQELYRLNNSRDQMRKLIRFQQQAILRLQAVAFPNLMDWACPLCSDAGEIVDNGELVGPCPRCGG